MSDPVPSEPAHRAWASIEIGPEADFPAILAAVGMPASANGIPTPDRALYDTGRLYVRGVAQDALDAALSDVGAGPSPALARATVRAAFDVRVAAGLPVAGQAGAVALDPDSRRELTAAALMASLGAWPERGFWRLSDNTSLPLSAAQVTALGIAAAGHYQVLFATRSALLDALAAGAAIDPEAGWPEAVPFDPAG